MSADTTPKGSATEFRSATLDEYIVSAGIPIRRYLYEAIVLLDSVACCSDPLERNRNVQLLERLAGFYQRRFGVDATVVSAAHRLVERLFPEANLEDGTWPTGSLEEDAEATEAFKPLNLVYRKKPEDWDEFLDESAQAYLIAAIAFRCVAAVCVGDECLTELSSSDVACEVAADHSGWRERIGRALKLTLWAERLGVDVEGSKAHQRRPYRLVAKARIAQAYGVDPSTVTRWSKKAGFPMPHGDKYRSDRVEEWVEKHANHAPPNWP